MKTTLFYLIFILICWGCTKEKSDNLTQFTELSFYFTTDTSVRTVLDIDNIQIEGDPFIPYSEIVSYDSARHILELDHRIDTLFDYTGNYDGRGFVAMLDTTKIYCGALYSPIHSSTNPNIVITLPCDEISGDHCLQILEGYPNEDYYAGHSDVNDPRIIELLKRDHKLN